jgi:P-type conjugative transfer protein TrbJ
MKPVRHLAAVSAVVLSLVFAAPASAQFVVFDPSNYAQNVITAANTLQQINNHITGLQN